MTRSTTSMKGQDKLSVESTLAVCAKPTSSQEKMLESDNHNIQALSIPERLSLFMERQGFTQATIAEGIGVARSQVSAWLRGKNQLSMPVALAMQAQFYLSATWLMHGSGKMITQSNSNYPELPNLMPRFQREPELVAMFDSMVGESNEFLYLFCRMSQLKEEERELLRRMLRAAVS